mmetsp:Transcript_5690/g.17365  ORF Transcript_5690/g.17365 Transcript_5690/m.17365 type:complete len:212 (-) Transcript_5690:146-781(-)
MPQLAAILQPGSNFATWQQAPQRAAAIRMPRSQPAAAAGSPERACAALGHNRMRARRQLSRLPAAMHARCQLSRHSRTLFGMHARCHCPARRSPLWAASGNPCSTLVGSWQARPWRRHLSRPPAAFFAWNIANASTTLMWPMPCSPPSMPPAPGGGAPRATPSPPPPPPIPVLWRFEGRKSRPPGTALPPLPSPPPAVRGPSEKSASVGSA